MGKRIISQRRGRGSMRYRSLSFKYKGAAKHIKKTGVVKDLLNCPGHSAPLAWVKYEGGEGLMLAYQGLSVGDKVEVGGKAKNGNTLMLKDVPEGTLVYNIERKPGDGGKFVRAGGTFGRIMNKLEDGSVLIKMPSKKTIKFKGDCKATLGIVAGGGRKDKPFLKAGKKWFAMRAKGRLYPETSGVAMNAIDHPFGSGRGRNLGKHSIAPRNAPPGRKVGQIKARRTGKKK